MKFPFFMLKLSVTVGFGVAALLAAAAVDRNPLLAERWKTRPVVVVVPTAQDPLLKKIETAIEETAVREAFLDRDMVLYTVVAGEGSRDKRPLAPDQTHALLKVLNLKASGPAAFVLVGKDGGTKMSEGADVDLKAVFAEIDRMPMRQPR